MSTDHDHDLHDPFADDLDRLPVEDPRRSCAACRADRDAAGSASVRLAAAAGLLDLAHPGPSDVLRARVLASVGAPVVAEQGSPSRAPDPRAPVLSAWLDRVRSVPRRWLAVPAMGAAGLALLAVLVVLPGTSRPALRVALAASDASGATAEIAVRPAPFGQSEMTVSIAGLPASRPGEFYELWWVGEGKKHVSCVTFRSDGSPIRLTVTAAGEPSAIRSLEVTLERDDGDTAPGPHVLETVSSERG